MKAVIYARYSSDSQREESIEGQIRECTEYANRNGMTILRSYIDRALSARTADRPEFQNMIRDSEKGLFDIVLVWKIDRFSRDRYDSAHYKHLHAFHERQNTRRYRTTAHSGGYTDSRRENKLADKHDRKHPHK